MESPPIKPPRGVKPAAKETSALLMSVIRTLSASETNEQRDREKAKLEHEYRFCNQKLDELVSKHEDDLTKVMQLFGTVSQTVSENRNKIAKVKENLQDCKRKLHCRRDELKNLWLEGLEYKNMLQILEEVENLNEIPDRLSAHIAKKQYLHATKLIVESANLNTNKTLEGVESLKDISQQMEQKKEQLQLELVQELKTHLYTKPAQNVLFLRRQESGRDFIYSSPFRRSVEQRNSFKNRQMLLNNSPQTNINIHLVEEDLSVENPEQNSTKFIAILVKSLFMLDKLDSALTEIKRDMQMTLLNTIQRTTQYLKDYSPDTDTVQNKNLLLELTQTLFEQFTAIAEAHKTLLKHVDKLQNGKILVYDMKNYWQQVQNVLENFLRDYLDCQNQILSDPQIIQSQVNDLSQFFARNKNKNSTKNVSLFKFHGSSSALTLNNAFKTIKADKLSICKSDSNNIQALFLPFINFIDHVEKEIDFKPRSCQLYQFLSQHVSDYYLKRKFEEISGEILSAVGQQDSWRATILIDTSSDYKALLISAVTVEKCIREFKSVHQSLPVYSEQIAVYSGKALKEYRDQCVGAYLKIVEPASDDSSKKICSAAWLRDEDISRFLKSLPNWLNLKSQQDFQARIERNNKKARRNQHQQSEEESPEDVRMRNKREAEILSSNLGESGIDTSEIISDMNLLKELAQLQESMEWFSVRMFDYISEYRQKPALLSPTTDSEGDDNLLNAPVTSQTLQNLTKIAQEFDELANTCLLLLHLEVRVQCFHYLLAQSHYNRETHEPDPKVLELSRVLASVDEAITSSLHPRKCKYIFEGLGHLIAKILISSAQYLSSIDESGIQRMCRNIFALQQTLTNITMTREVALDQARHYFEMFFLTPEEILDGIVEKGAEFSELEYMNALQLLGRSRVGKGAVVAGYLERLSDILGEVLNSGGGS